MPANPYFHIDDDESADRVESEWFCDLETEAEDLT